MGIHRKGGPTAELLLTRVSEESNRAMSGMPIARSSSIAWLKHLRGTHGSQLLEFALALPFLLAFVVGIIDFGKAYNIKHILTNAAREGARLTSSTPLTDVNCSDTTPCSIQASADAVKQYLYDAGLTAASCIKPNAPASGGVGPPLTPWTYSCSGITLTINRAVNNVATSSGQTIPCTQVTVSYPYTFTFGRIIGLLVQGQTGPAGPQTMTASAVMQNLTY
jgi:Flp pilus assembly protein TadG